MKKTVKTSGMHCKSCKMLVEDAVSAIQGVSSAKADFEKNEVVVEFEQPATEAQVRKAIEGEGYKVKA